MGRLDGRVAMVTGAASGIGRAIARRFAAEGAAILIADLSETVREGGEPTRTLIEAEGHPVRFIETDVSDEAQAQAAIDAAVASFGRLDILVNNAAIGTDTPLTKTPLADWNRVMAVNLTGPFLMARAAVRQMLTQDIVKGVRGRIVNITSQHGMVAAPNDIAYGVSKSGLVYMTRQIAVDYAKHHILCNAVAPGKILTGKTGRAVDAEILAYSESRTPMPRLGTPEDVAGAALFLASDDASYVTGENLMVDGGGMAY